MKIRQVEELVGITKKNIRFYEEKGLLKVERAENGYREYHAEDILRLKEIKLFRKLSFSIEEIRDIFSGERTLEYCLRKQLDDLEKQKILLDKRENICRSMLNEHVTYDSLSQDGWLDKMEHMEKEGKIFMDIEKNDVRKKKIAGAFIPAVLMSILMLSVGGFVLWANTQGDMPIAILLISLVIIFFIVVLIFVVLYQRIKEIKGGEEDEAAKY